LKIDTVYYKSKIDAIYNFKNKDTLALIKTLKDKYYNKKYIVSMASRLKVKNFIPFNNFAFISLNGKFYLDDSKKNIFKHTSIKSTP